MSKKEQESSKDLTIGELCELEEAAEKGDLQAKKRLEELKQSGEYPDIKPILDAIDKASENLVKSNLATSLKTSAQNNLPKPSGRIASIFSGFIYKPPEERLADEIAENTQTQRELLQEIRAQREDSRKDIAVGGAEQNGNPSPRKKDSAHYAYPPEKRREIAEQFIQDYRNGKVYSKESWAKKWNISSKTLNKYLKEFP